jgi:hypothetical protein
MSARRKALSVLWEVPPPTQLVQPPATPKRIAAANSSTNTGTSLFKLNRRFSGATVSAIVEAASDVGLVGNSSFVAIEFSRRRRTDEIFGNHKQKR